MRAVKVEYTIKPGYVDTNKANIKKVMDELRALGDVGILYSSYVKEDGCSFVHFSIHRDSEEPNLITSLAAFKVFSAQLKAEGLVAPPQSVKLDMVANHLICKQASEIDVAPADKINHIPKEMKIFKYFLLIFFFQACSNQYKIYNKGIEQNISIAIKSNNQRNIKEYTKTIEAKHYQINKKEEKQFNESDLIYYEIVIPSQKKINLNIINGFRSAQERTHDSISIEKLNSNEPIYILSNTLKVNNFRQFFFFPFFHFYQYTMH